MAYTGSSFFKQPNVQRIVEADKDLSRPFGAGPLVSIVWYKGPGQTPHKIFANCRVIKDIRHRLEYKGIKSTEKNKTLDFAQDDILSFVYYSKNKDDYRMAYIPFKIEDGIFYWPYGEDKKVAQMLMNKEKWDQHFFHIGSWGVDYLKEEKVVQEKLGMRGKLKKISQIKNSLAKKV